MAVKPSDIKNLNVANLNIADYSYELPASRIAQVPLFTRDSSKLLIYDHGNISDGKFFNIVEKIPANSLLVVNNSRVIHARFFFTTETGAQIEILFLEPIEPSSVELAMSAQKNSTWFAYVGNLRRWKNDELSGTLEGVTVKIKKEISNGDMQRINISWSSDSPDYANLTLGELFERAGHVPLPPYMKRDDVVSDKERYQTVYAKPQGSVAAPTAGLHFTPAVFASLISKGVDIENVTLHVGAGTFKSVSAPNISSHEMHSEHIVVSRAFIETLKTAIVSNRTIVCVGTTSVRTIESLYWIGAKLSLDKNDISIKQWEAYELSASLSAVDALDSIIRYLDFQKMEHLRTSTQLLILPGYEFKFVKMLVTNFHVPMSTLLLLVSAFIGDDWKKVYSHALANDYRFLSYGDSSLLIPKTEKTTKRNA